MVLALDPGPVRSALVLYDGRAGLCSHYLAPNAWILAFLKEYAAAEADVLVIEQIASFGMPVGGEIFETCFWSGRFAQEWIRRGHACARVKRIDVKLALCGVARAKDANIRQALIDRFGGPAATKKGGPLYKVSADTWAALAVAVVWCDPHALPAAAITPTA